MLLDRFGQLNKFWKKGLKYFEHPSEYSEGNLRYVMRKSWGRPEWTSQGLPLKVRPARPLESQIRTSSGRYSMTSPRRHIKTSPGRQIRASPGRSDRIFRVRTRDVGGTCSGCPGTNLCQLGNLTANLKRAENTRFYFILEEAKETAFEFSQGTVKVL